MDKLDEISFGLEFIKAVFQQINQQIDKHGVLTKADYQFIVKKELSEYESRVENRKSTTGNRS